MSLFIKPVVYYVDLGDLIPIPGRVESSPNIQCKQDDTTATVDYIEWLVARQPNALKRYI
jgi:hypothetical protein